MSHTYLFTSESVSEGHPDKISDQISDAVLDAIIAQDVRARVACETMVKTGMVVVAGEVTTEAWVDIEHLVRETVLEIGYTDSDMGFDGKSCAVLNALGKQSKDINQGVDREDPESQGAGDQGAGACWRWSASATWWWCRPTTPCWWCRASKHNGCARWWTR